MPYSSLPVQPSPGTPGGRPRVCELGGSPTDLGLAPSPAVVGQLSAGVLVLPCRVSLRATTAPSLPTARQAVGSPSPCRACWTRPPREASSPGPSSTFLKAFRYGPRGGKGRVGAWGLRAPQAVTTNGHRALLTMGCNQSFPRLSTDELLWFLKW